jgi:hypothetical protein
MVCPPQPEYGVNFPRSGGDDPGVLANAVDALFYFGEDLGAMMALVDRALALNPSFAAAGTSAVS